MEPHKHIDAIHVASDDAQLAALGYTSNFDRTMSVWQNFALGFTYLSPVVGVYSVFAFGLQAGGPPMIWSYVIAGLGQFLVALIFGEVVSQFPISGGLYPWARRLVGRRWAWMAGWIYGWALFTTIAAVALGAGPFLATLFGVNATPAFTTIAALVLVALTTAINMRGTKLLAQVAMFGFICELVGAIVVGVDLLTLHRAQPLSVVFNTFNIQGTGSYWPAFLASALVGLFCCYGFEACGDVAEETPNPGVEIPKAMRMTIYVGVGASIFVCLALIMSIPNMADVISGKEADPIGTVLTSAFGPLGAKAVIVIVMVSFISCALSLQAAVSRLLYSYARDEMIIGSRFLSRMAENAHVPEGSLLIAGLAPAAIVAIGYFLQNALATVLNFAVIGIYLAFQMVVVAALVARARGWQPSGKFRLNGWAWLVNILALGYGVAAIINMAWPRTPSEAWYLNWSMPLTVAIIGGAGLLYMVLGRPYLRGTAPYGDAAKLHLRAD
ncbi:APC family permease [Acidocella sp. KAb 2-4]|uniref:APC family permease n=1 Tax=Acidocella sp. KAb 2-4 TaxID=2885158 RepID=UPI001D087DD8|nr:amino acid permease [Acidocella sp. KAb 2-4]MCB5943817.1 amino acid permease [Acidocella sp. KAb 2-4]